MNRIHKRGGPHHTPDQLVMEALKDTPYSAATIVNREMRKEPGYMEYAHDNDYVTPKQTGTACYFRFLDSVGRIVTSVLGFLPNPSVPNWQPNVCMQMLKKSRPMATDLKAVLSPALHTIGDIVGIGTHETNCHNDIISDWTFTKYGERTWRDRKDRILGWKNSHDVRPIARSIVSLGVSSVALRQSEPHREELERFKKLYTGERVVLYDDSIGYGISFGLVLTALKDLGMSLEHIYPVALITEHIYSRKPQ